MGSGFWSSPRFHASLRSAVADGKSCTSSDLFCARVCHARSMQSKGCFCGLIQVRNTCYTATASWLLDNELRCSERERERARAREGEGERDRAERWRERDRDNASQ